MKKFLAALAMLVASSAHGALYEFTGTCTEREVYGTTELQIPCDDAPVEGTFEYRNRYDFLFTLYDSFAGGWVEVGPGDADLYFGGPNDLYLWIGGSDFRLSPDGSWEFFIDYVGGWYDGQWIEARSMYRMSGINGTLTLIPLPGTLALMGLGLAGFAAARRRKQ